MNALFSAIWKCLVGSCPPAQSRPRVVPKPRPPPQARYTAPTTRVMPPPARQTVQSWAPPVGGPVLPRVMVLSKSPQCPQIQYWQQQGWRRVDDCLFLGYLKTPAGRCHGVIKWRSPRDFGVYVHDVPQELLRGPHGACFAMVKPGKFRVHFAVTPRDVNSIIIYLETLLLEAFNNGRQVQD